MNILKSSDADYIANEVIFRVHELCGAHNIFIAFVNQEKGTYTLEKGIGIFSNLSIAGSTEDRVVKQVYQTKKMVIVEHYDAWNCYGTSDSRFGEIAYLAVLPLVYENKIIALIEIAFLKSEDRLSQDGIYLLQSYITLASIALGNAFHVLSLREGLLSREKKIKELIYSNEKFSTIFQLQQSAVGVMGLDGTYVSVNACFCQTIGYTEKELLGQTGIKLGLWVHDKDQRLLIEKVKKQREVTDFEVWLLCKNGKKICGSLAARLIFISNEAFILCSMHDITQQKNIAEKPNLLEATYAQLFYINQEGIVVFWFDGTIMEVNPGFTWMSGFSRDEILGKTLIELGFCPPLEDKAYSLEELFYRNIGQQIKVPFRHKDGHIIYIQSVVCKLSLSGEFYFMAIMRGTTAQIRLDQGIEKQEKMLSINKDKLSTAAGLASLGDWEYDPSTGMFEFSDEFYAIYNTNAAREGREMSFSTYLKEFVYPEDSARLSRERDILSAAKPTHVNSKDLIYRIIRRDGTIRTMLVRRKFIKNADGNIIKVYGINQDITERLQVENERCQQAETIRHMAYFDFMTNLPNRHSLVGWLSGEMKQVRLGKASGVVLVIDLDDLKMINDTYGRMYGDKIITASSRRLIEVLGKNAFLSRIGGDEFVAVLQGKYQHEQIEGITREIIKVLSQRQEYLGMGFHITASIGIACYPRDANTVDEIIKRADNAVFAAKKEGKNCWQFYNEKMQNEAYKKIHLVEQLRCALNRGELSLSYQPQVDVLQRTVAGFEVLLRWNSHEYGSVPPLQFIPLAEQSGLIHNIGTWVLQEACFFARRLVDQGWGGVRVAINVSAKQVNTDDFVAIICGAVNAAGIKPQQLDIEITESVFMTSLDDAIRKLKQLKDFGVRLSLDDFGTGFSSLTYLRLLPFDALKIDKSFIDLIEIDRQGASIIDTIINMAQAKNMSVVAEGVETEKQLAYLIDKGCDCIQGYLFSKPLTEKDAIKMLSDEL